MLPSLNKVIIIIIIIWVQNSNVWIHQNLNSPKVQIHWILDWIYTYLSKFLKYWISRTVEFVDTLNSTNLIKKVEFIKLLNLLKPGVRRSSIFIEPLHLVNYQIHRTSEFIEISILWKPQIHRILGPVLRVHQSPTNPCEVPAFSKWRTRPNTRRDLDILFQIFREDYNLLGRQTSLTLWFSNFPIAADKLPSCTIWKVQRRRALYISCYSFVTKCRRVWNKPWLSCNFWAEHCRRKTEIRYSTGAEILQLCNIWCLWDLYDKDSTSLAGIEESCKAACLRIWYIRQTKSCFRWQWTRYIRQRHPERVSKRRIS